MRHWFKAMFLNRGATKKTPMSKRRKQKWVVLGLFSDRA